MLLVLSVLLTAGDVPAASAPATQPARGFLHKTVTLGGETYAYCVWIPPTYTGARSLPAILFLHGSGERGEDGFLQTAVGLPASIRRRHTRAPAVVIMPQCRAKQAWTGPMAELALACLDQTLSEYNIDRRRVYLTGLSLGGAGCWTLAAMRPQQWAAIAPICGFGDPNSAAAFAKTPIWAFHGEKDDRVPAAESRKMIDALQAAAGAPKYTEFPGKGHVVWDEVYDDADFWKWLYGQQRPQEP